MKKILIVFGCCFCISALDASYGGAEEKDYSNSGYDMIFQTPESSKTHKNASNFFVSSTESS